MNVFRAVIFACVMGMVHGQTDCDIKLYQRFASNENFNGIECGFPNTIKFIRSVDSTGAPWWVDQSIIETNSTMLSKERCQHRCYEESDCDYFFYQIYYNTHTCYLIKEYDDDDCNMGNYQPYSFSNTNIRNQATGEGCPNLNTCLEGQYGTTGNCIDCAAGTYSSVTGATSASVCTDCAAGTYSSETGVSVCTSCAAGTYSSVTGATSASVCTSCAADKTSFAGSTQCYTASEMFTALGAGVSKQDIIDLYTDVHGTCG